MGQGLQLQPTGLHVAFCAGTGALVFLDLVAQLLILNTFKADGKGLPEEASFFQDGFKLHLYVSFSNREKALGLEIIEALDEVNKVLELDNFKAVVRLSEGAETKMPRWTPDYIATELGQHTGMMKKVWVCGPP